MQRLLTATTCVVLAGCPADDKVDTDVCHAIAEGTACDDSNPCTTDDKCGDGLCLGAPVEDRTHCDDQDPCTIDDECVAGTCAGLDVCGRLTPVDPTGCGDQPSGTPCDDEDACTTGDQCNAAGHCVGVGVQCATSSGGCVVGGCNPDDGQCVEVVAADGKPCDDGDPCTVGEACGSGQCAGATFAPDGTVCDDADEDTLGDRCQSGLCAGEPRPCAAACCDVAEGTLCDDGNGCTEGDLCAAGLCVGAQVSMDCSAHDAACVVGACVPATGECGPTARPDGIECDDSKLCTLQDSCQAGTCRGVAKSCNSLDSQCVVGVCGAADGGCQAVKRSDGFPCHDGDPCTGHDDCTDGACGGEVDLCGACEGLSTGAACDDGDPCTPGAGVCVQVAAGLRCDSEAKACSSAATACAVGACDPSTGDGTCVPIALHDGASCDDGDPCTHLDSCATGECQGQPREVCGDAGPDFCETGASNDTLADAIPLAVTDSLTVLGGFPSIGDIDWYAIDVQAGQLIDVTTRPHCNSQIDTLITALRPNGKTTVAAGVDAGGEGGFAVLKGDRAGGDGTYYIGIAAVAATSGNTYFVDIVIHEPQPCTEDAQCLCTQLECAVGGAAEGTCVPNIPVELEPNDGAALAGLLPLESTRLGRLGSPSDQDWYRLELQGGTPITVTTRASCDEAADPPGAGADPQEATLDTEVRLYATNGTDELALATTDPTGGAAAQLTDFLVPEDGVYFARIRGEAGALGAYTITAAVTGCGISAPCTCLDQACSAATAGICLPKLTAPEPGANDGPSVGLLLSKRLHSTIEVPYDDDVFDIALGEGTYDIATYSFCGSALDTRLMVYDAALEGAGSNDPAALLAQDDDSGEQLFASVVGLEVQSAVSLRMVVSASGAAVGSYMITVKPTAEAAQ